MASKEYSFTSPPAPSNIPYEGESLNIVAYGDMGNAPLDGSSQHSWDFNDKGEIPSVNTTRRIVEEIEDNGVDMVLHIGDISYAVGYLSEWESFLQQIEPVASKVPYEVGIGNHEVGWTGSFLPGEDSGGECGVPYNAHFPYASQNPASGFKDRKPWYSVDYGMLHVVFMSTEHNFTQGSEQYAWIEKDLAGVNRSWTPWVVFTGHRPMYLSSTYDGDVTFGQMMAKNLEPLFVQYPVDVCLWGHFHAYQRTCPMLNGKCQKKGNAPTHLVIGTAGYEHSNTFPTKLDPFVVTGDDQHYGFLRMVFANRTALRMQYVVDIDRSVQDDFWVTK
jgi:hypothetical protein